METSMTIQKSNMKKQIKKYALFAQNTENFGKHHHHIYKAKAVRIAKKASWSENVQGYLKNTE